MQKLILELGITISSGYDLNNITDFRVLRSENSSKTATLKNVPSCITTGFKLIVIPITSEEYIKQIILLPTSNTIYIRLGIESSWNDWEKLYTSN